MVNFEQREIDLENEKIINEVILKFSTVKISLYGNFHGFPLCKIIIIPHGFPKSVLHEFSIAQN